MIEICSLRTESVAFAYDVRVDRANPILGNRFRMTSESDRDRVCDMYERWFNTQLAEQNEVFLNELRRLYVIHRTYGKLRLFCWCAPKRCHAETIRNFLNKYIWSFYGGTTYVRHLQPASTARQPTSGPTLSSLCNMHNCSLRVDILPIRPLQPLHCHRGGVQEQYR